MTRTYRPDKGVITLYPVIFPCFLFEKSFHFCLFPHTQNQKRSFAVRRYMYSGMLKFAKSI